MLKITKAEENIRVENLFILIYGTGGIGKTSLAQTAENPLTLDFNMGIYRTAYRRDVYENLTYEMLADPPRKGKNGVVFFNQTSFATFAEQAKSSGYKTIVVDTLEDLLQSIGQFIIKHNSKYAEAKYQLKYYGLIKDEFVRFVRMLKELKLDVVAIAHSKNKGKDEKIINYPQITGGAYDEVKKTFDFIGHYYFRTENGVTSRILDFDPSEEQDGKNSCQIPAEIVPHFNKSPYYLRDLIATQKELLNKNSQAQKEAVELLLLCADKFAQFKNLEDYNSHIEWAKSQTDIDTIKKQIGIMLTNSAKEKGFVFDTKTSLYKEKELPKEEKE